MGKAPASIEKLEDRGDSVPALVEYGRDLGAEQAGGSNHSCNWPFACYGSGVNAAQAPELREFFKEKGFDCEVTRDGDPVYTSPNHRRAALKLRNMQDKSAYY